MVGCATVSGPNARLILEKAGCSIALDNESFGFMSYKDAMLGDLPVRIFRISFTGELSFEINTPARYGLALWERLIKAGQDYGLTPYGTETMHVLTSRKRLYYCRARNRWLGYPALIWGWIGL